MPDHLAFLKVQRSASPSALARREARCTRSLGYFESSEKLLHSALARRQPPCTRSLGYFGGSEQLLPLGTGSREAQYTSTLPPWRQQCPSRCSRCSFGSSATPPSLSLSQGAVNPTSPHSNPSPTHIPSPQSHLTPITISTRPFRRNPALHRSGHSRAG